MSGTFKRTATALGLAGLVCILFGGLAKVPVATYVGYALGAPIVVGGLVAGIIGLPLALLERSKARREERSTPHEDHDRRG